jgi:hypothetical protein
MEICRPDGLGDIANLGLTSAEGKQLLASSATGRRCRASHRSGDAMTELPILWSVVPCEGLEAAPDCHACSAR